MDVPSPAPFTPAHPDLSAVTGYRIIFGDLDAGTEGGMAADSALAQRVELDAGRYRISWYAASVGTGPAQEDAVDVLNVDSGLSLLSSTYASELGMDGWSRYWKVFDLDGPATVEVAIVPDPAAVPLGPQQIDLAALMLEDISLETPPGSFVLADFPPRVFANTGDTLTTEIQVCEDATGQIFRGEHWRRGCVRICAEGFGRGCDGTGGVSYCYRETQFTITQRDIERGRLVQSGGFARGNYNYRAENIGLNFVGTNSP